MIDIANWYMATVIASVEKMQEHHGVFLVPILMRLGCLLIHPTFHHLFHKGVHNLMHLSAHHISAIEKLFSKLVWLPDTLMILSLLALQLLIG